MVGGQTDHKLTAVLRNEQAMNQHLAETRAALREAETHINELKAMVMQLAGRADQHDRDIALMRAQALGGGAT